MASQVWNPGKYLAFQKQRLRPAIELLARVPTVESSNANGSKRLVDIGAGTGSMAPHFLQRWPSAKVELVDSSAEMLQKAKEAHADLPAIKYTQCSFEEYTPSEPVDIIYSNAALHWVDVDTQVALLRRFFGFLHPGGTLAFQIPDTRGQPSHDLILETARVLGWSDRLADVRLVRCERDPSFYYDLFQSLDTNAAIDMWSTTYSQVLPGENPVADFTGSTALGPFIEALGGRDASDGMTFERKYRHLVSKAYPKAVDGNTVWPYKRFFCIVTKSSR